MNTIMVIPTYWTGAEGKWQEGDSVYDHPTSLDEEGTLKRTLDSIHNLEDDDFAVVIIGAVTNPRYLKLMEDKVRSIILSSKLKQDIYLFTERNLEQIKDKLGSASKKILSLCGYSNIRNLCLFVPYILDADVAVLIDDDEIFEDPKFISYLSAVSPIIANSFLQSKVYSRIESKTSVPETLSETEVILSNIDNQIELSLNKNEKLALIILDIEPIIDFLEEQQPGIDSFRIKQDVLKILSTMVESIGNVFDLPHDKALLFLSSKTAVKTSLLINQIQISLQSFFHNHDYFPQIKAMVKQIPEDGMDSSILKEYL